MPSSRPHVIPVVLETVRSLQPQSILDVGVGFGKWGHLFREYTDINAAEFDPERYFKRNWRVRIDGIEGHAPYLTEMHRFLYDTLYEEDARAVLPRLGEYDLIFFGDIIEHLEKSDGMRLLEAAYRKARKAVLVSTPKLETAQGGLCNNPLEAHQSLWSVRDFRRFPGSAARVIHRETILALLPKPGLPYPAWTDRSRARVHGPPGMGGAMEALIRIIPNHVPFILVDEEQIRSLLPHQMVWAFLEKDGEYWGPPARDAEAIECVERLKAAGARYLAVVWSAWWWLDRFPAWARHIRSHYRLVADDPQVRVFDLTRRP